MRTLTLFYFIGLFMLFSCSQHKKEPPKTDDQQNTIDKDPKLEAFSNKLKDVQDSVFTPSDSLFSGFTFRMNRESFKAQKARQKTSYQHIFNSLDTDQVYVLQSPLGVLKATTLNGYYDEKEGLKGLFIVTVDSNASLVKKATALWGNEMYGIGERHMWLKNNWNIEIAQPSNLPNFSCLIIYDAKRSKVGHKYPKID